MFMLTEAAGAHLAKILAEQETPENENVVMRVLEEEDCFTLTLDQTSPDDMTIAHEGVTVLAIDEQLFQALADYTLDVETTQNGERLTLR